MSFGFGTTTALINERYRYHPIFSSYFNFDSERYYNTEIPIAVTHRTYGQFSDKGQILMTLITDDFNPTCIQPYLYYYNGGGKQGTSIFCAAGHSYGFTHLEARLFVNIIAWMVGYRLFDYDGHPNDHQTYELVKNTGTPPQGALATGHQSSGVHYAAIAHTAWGDIPGKAMGNTCWYPYDGAEHATYYFSWVVGSGFRLERSNGFPPTSSLPLGHQNDATGTVWVAVAHVNGNDIPGKAKGNTCWYPDQGRELTTNEFSWVCL